MLEQDAFGSEARRLIGEYGEPTIEPICALPREGMPVDWLREGRVKSA